MYFHIFFGTIQSESVLVSGIVSESDAESDAESDSDSDSTPCEK